ncbi:MAG: glycine reductase, partial [bacterium]
MTPILRAAANVLFHVPDLVRYGSRPFREGAARPGDFSAALARGLRSFGAAAAYPPNQVFIGNAAPESLRDTPAPWFDHPAPGASPRGAFGEILPQAAFYALLRRADQFGLVMMDAARAPDPGDLPGPAAALLGGEEKEESHGEAEISGRIEKGDALSLEHEGERIGCVRRDHEADESL